MKTSYKIALALLATIIAFGAFFAYLTTVKMPLLDPSGLIAIKEKKLIVVATILMMIVVVPVFTMMIYFAIKYREGNKAEYKPDYHHSFLAESVWWGVPFVITTILATIAWTSSHQLNPYKPLVSSKKTLTIQVVALDWKWLFIYPEQNIATINLMQFPEKTPIRLEITADAPMNSFWIPDLSGQIYGMPGMATQLHLIADKKGSYRGSSAQINGTGFAGMVFEAKATSEDDFDLWINKVKQSKNALNQNTYKELLKPSQYDPVKYFSLDDDHLFIEIVNKYNNPKV